jgi:hypothetical protein
VVEVGSKKRRGIERHSEKGEYKNLAKRDGQFFFVSDDDSVFGNLK